MVRIQRAGPELADELTRIAHAAKRHWGYPERWIERWRDQLTLTRPFVATHPVHAAWIEGRPVGLYALVERGRRAELEHFWVRPDHHGRGIGRALFEHACATAAARGARTLEILSDPRAEGFYLAMGARRAGEVPAPVDGDPGRVLPRLELALADSRPT